MYSGGVTVRCSKKILRSGTSKSSGWSVERVMWRMLGVGSAGKVSEVAISVGTQSGIHVPKANAASDLKSCRRFIVHFHLLFTLHEHSGPDWISVCHKVSGKEVSNLPSADSQSTMLPVAPFPTVPASRVESGGKGLNLRPHVYKTCALTD